MIPKIRRKRDKAHLQYVASKPCLVCGRSPADAHHLCFSEPRALGRKVSDEFTVPLCRAHHRQAHDCGDEKAWWQEMIRPGPSRATAMEPNKAVKLGPRRDAQCSLVRREVALLTVIFGRLLHKARRSTRSRRGSAGNACLGCPV